MCPPLIAAAPIILASVSAATAAAQGYAAQQQAKQQQGAINTQYANQQKEIATQASVQAGARVAAARAERAKMTVAAGEAGVSGVSVHDLITTSGLNQAQDVALIGKNEFFQSRASNAEASSLLAKAQGPTALELGLGIGGAALSGYDTGTSFKNSWQKAHVPPPPKLP